MGKSQTKAKNKYNAKAYDRISVTVKKGMKDEWKSEADKQGLSLNAFIENAVNQKIEQEKNYRTLLAITIHELDLPVIADVCLTRAKINTIGDFKQFIETNEISKIRNMDKKRATYIFDKLKEYEHKYNATLNIDYDNLLSQLPHSLR